MRAQVSPSAGRSESTLVIRFRIDKDHYRRLEVEPGVMVCHLYPTLAEWIGRKTPDSVNPRSHQEESLTGQVPKAIEATIKDAPDDFYLANRGETILAESISFDPATGMIEIVLSEFDDPEARHGVADGGTTDAVIHRVQRHVANGASFEDIPQSELPAFLTKARVHLEVIVGLNDRSRIDRLVRGRNTSRQVTQWTMSNFRGEFDWIKESLDAEDSPFRGKIGYEENAECEVTILDVLAILTLFHPEYNERNKAPTVAYSSKGRLDSRLVNEATTDGYRVLEPLLRDLLELWEFVQCHFPEKYKEAFVNGKLGSRGTAQDRIFRRSENDLPLTGLHAEYEIPTGVLFPLLASFRALVKFPVPNSNGMASWRIVPKAFFREFGAELVENVIAQLELVNSNPNTMGKTKTVYLNLHDRARLLVNDALEQ